MRAKRSIAGQWVRESPTVVPCQVQSRYLLFLPREYEADEKRRWPLLLFLHGAGERGSDLSKVTVHGPPKIVRQRPEFPFIVVSPQCPRQERWVNEPLLALLDEVTRQFRVDPRRVYATGLSMGGYGVWNLALACPERFAAVAPVCGGGELIPILLAGAKQLRALRTLGVWAFHGAEDPVVPVTESERMISALREIGNPARLTVYPQGGHDSWTETYENPALYRWLLTHQRPSHGKRSSAGH